MNTTGYASSPRPTCVLRKTLIDPSGLLSLNVPLIAFALNNLVLAYTEIFCPLESRGIPQEAIELRTSFIMAHSTGSRVGRMMRCLKRAEHLPGDRKPMEFPTCDSMLEVACLLHEKGHTATALDFLVELLRISGFLWN